MCLCGSHCLQLSVGQPNSRVVALSQLKLASVFHLVIFYYYVITGILSSPLNYDWKYCDYPETTKA